MRTYLTKPLCSILKHRNQFTILAGRFCSEYLKAVPSSKEIVQNNTFEKKNSLKKMSEYTYPNNTPVIYLNCEKAFDALSQREKLYSHYLAKASQYGGLIALVQTSLESSLIFTLLHKIFRSEPITELKKTAIEKCHYTEEEFTSFLIYAAAIFGNMGNYKSFGDFKFVPNMTKEKFTSLVLASKAANAYPDQVATLLSLCGEKIFSLEAGEKQLGFHEIGITTYLSQNITKADSNILANFLKEKKVDPYNSRAFKTLDETGASTFDIKFSSVAKTEDSDVCDLLGNYTVNGNKFVVSRGDFRELLEKVNQFLLLAKEYTSNENETKMLDHYVRSFQTGVLDEHKDGSRYWIKNKGPIIETYIGFIETYRDPAGIRGEFEGFVAMVNKPMSQKFTTLVEEAEKLLPLLPWPRSYEKDEFLRPDFTSLDVLSFCGSGVPAGINIPNYDDIKQNEGFKNVSLGNVIQTAYKGVVPNYLSKDDQELLLKYNVASFEVQVGLHELLGHGSGKQFNRTKDGKFNFDIEAVRHLETNEKITSWYEEGESYDSVFTSMGSAFEECRAECVGLYLSTVPEVLKIFGYEGEEAETVLYANWLGEIHSGLESLQMYEPKTKSWLQAHCQARHAILQVLIEAGEGFVQIKSVKGEDGNPDLLLTVDRSKIQTVGKPAIGNFLRKIQMCRSTADVKYAKTMFDKYTDFTSEDLYPFLSYREIVMARKKPRKILVQANTFIQDGKVVLRGYDSTPEGMVQSWLERFDDMEDVEKMLFEQYKRDEPHFSKS